MKRSYEISGLANGSQDGSQERPKMLSRQARARKNKKLKKDAASFSNVNMPILVETAETQEIHNKVYDLDQVFKLLLNCLKFLS